MKPIVALKALTIRDLCRATADLQRYFGDRDQWAAVNSMRLQRDPPVSLDTFPVGSNQNSDSRQRVL
jgi:hypothetical protein